MTAAGSLADEDAMRELAGIRDLIRRQEYGAGLDRGLTLLGVAARHREVLYVVAVCQRLLGRAEAALQSLAECEVLHPGFARLFQERGHVYRSVGEALPAVEAYERAVKLNPVLIASWRMLAALQRTLGLNAEAAAAETQCKTLKILPPAVLSGAGLLYEGDLAGAERILRQFLTSNPTHVEAMRLLAQVGARMGVLDDAEFLLESALEFEPNNTAVRYEYGCVLAERHLYARAAEQARQLLALDPTSHAYRTLHANASVGLGRHQEALDVYNTLSAESPGNADLHLSIGHARKTIGDQAEAIEAYRRAIEARPNFGDAYWSLANLKTYRFSADQIVAMKATEQSTTVAPVDRIHLCFALGKALEDEEDYANAYFYYERGNALKRAESRYDVSSLERHLQRQKDALTKQFFAERRGWGSAATDPIFIVGMPRSGSTLLEQILGSHSQIEGTMELADIPRLAQRVSGRERIDQPSSYVEHLAKLAPEDLRGLGAEFITETRAYRSTSRPFFIDKLPNNFRHIGLIHLILPRARIIDARRDPMACCFSNFKQLYAAGQDFSYDLDSLARYYKAYVQLMDHWDAVLPGVVLKVQHEEVVADLEGNVRRLLDYLGLEFEPACLEFHKNARSVRTASSEQVRRPIYREGLEQWRHFRQWLAPLEAALA